jgi:hypothetical protein
MSQLQREGSCRSQIDRQEAHGGRIVATSSITARSVVGMAVASSEASAAREL